MDFIDEVRTRSSRFAQRLEHLDTEEATKTALVMPFIQLLGYNIFDPTEVRPEFTADFGIRKGEKVDYAILQDGQPIVVIEAKKYGAPLQVQQESQLFRYFSTTEARFGVLTDGIQYRFYSDLDEQGKMDVRPFFEFNMLDFTDNQVQELKRFHKDTFNIAETIEAARELKYTNEVRHVLSEEMTTPSEQFVRFILHRIEYPGSKSRQRIAQFAPLVQSAFSNLVKDMIDARLKSALEQGKEQVEPAIQASRTAANVPTNEWVPLSDIGIPSGEVRPSEIRFPDGSTARLNSWAGLWVETVRWLTDQHHLMDHHMPVQMYVGSNASWIATTPFHPDGRGFQVSREVGRFHVLLNANSRRLLRACLVAIGVANQDPVQFQVYLVARPTESTR